MTEELLENIRENVNKKKEQIEDYNDKLKRLKELEEKEDVKEYMQLKNLSKSFFFERKVGDEVYYNAFNACRDKEGVSVTNGIYLFLYSRHYLNRFKRSEYRCYMNIENFEETLVTEENFEKFEKEHIVIYNEELVTIQKEFLKEAVEHSQEEAVKVISKKYRSSK